MLKVLTRQSALCVLALLAACDQMSTSGAAAARLAPELADAEALEALADWQRLPVFHDGLYLQQSSHDRGAPEPHGAELPTLAQYGNRDMNNFVCRSADAQLGESHIVPLRFDEGQCREDYVRGGMIARHAGSGALRRLWLTSLSQLFGDPLTDELLRIYVDDDPRPVVQLPLAQIMSGEAGEIFAPPFGAGSRSCIAWYYPVVFEKKLVVALDQLHSEYYFQTDVVLDRAPRARFAPAQRLPERDAAIRQLSAASPVPTAAQSLARESIALTRGETRSVELTGPTTLSELRLRAPAARLKDLAGVQLQVRWDDDDEPAIALPLLELFGAARSVVPRSSLALATRADGADQELALRLPMPFRQRARWQLENTADARAELQLEWSGVQGVPDADFGYLHVQRDQVPLPAMQVEQKFAQADRRGRYVGLCADLAGHADPAILGSQPLHLLEGDVRASADGQIALDGTGTEDYPDNAFYFQDTPSATPFAQSWGVVSNPFSQPAGQASFCRWQVLGSELDFQSSFRGSFEIAQHDTAIVELHRTVAFLYLAH